MAHATVQPARAAGRLAARFAATEAAIRAFALAEVETDGRDIEVRRDADGACHPALHGCFAAAAQCLGSADIALSLSHDGDYAVAVAKA